MRLPTYLFAVLLVACAAPGAQWEKPGASQSGVNEDLEQCRTQARITPEPGARVPDPAMPGVVPREVEERDARAAQQFQQCMQQKGYSAKR